MVDRYANGDSTNDADANPSDPVSFHGGDIRGIIDHIDHIESLGIQTVWLTPISKMRTEPIDNHGAFHGYWVDQMDAVEPRFGTIEDILELKTALHQRNMKLIIDVVLNHVGPGTSLTQQHPNWFHSFGDIKDWGDAQQRRTHDVHGLPDLAQEKEEVASYLIAQSTEWIRKISPDGFRIDAVRHVDPGFLSRYISELGDLVDPSFAFMGEVFDGNPYTVSTEARRTGLTHVFDFPMHFAMIDTMCNDGDLRQIAVMLTQDRLYENPHSLITFLDNHDTSRLQTVCNSPGKAEKAVSLLTTLRGIPSFTWGTSAGLQGNNETEARGDMVFDKTPLYKTIQERLKQRQNIPSLHKGSTDILSASKDSIVFARVLANQAVVTSIGLVEKPTLPAIAGSATWSSIPSDGLQRWVVIPQTVDGFSQWAEAIAEEQLKTRTIRLRSASHARFIGSDPALGAWKPKEDQSAGLLTVDLPAGGWVAVKTYEQTKSGETIWSPHSNVFIDVDAASLDASKIDIPH
jgi:glycosidase